MLEAFISLLTLYPNYLCVLGVCISGNCTCANQEIRQHMSCTVGTAVPENVIPVEIFGSKARLSFVQEKSQLLPDIRTAPTNRSCRAHVPACIHTYMFADVQKNQKQSVFVHAHLCMYIYTYICIYTCMYTFDVYIYICTQLLLVSLRVFSCISAKLVCECISAFNHLWMSFTLTTLLAWILQVQLAHIRVCIYKYTYICTHTYALIHMRTYIHA